MVHQKYAATRPSPLRQSQEVSSPEPSEAAPSVADSEIESDATSISAVSTTTGSKRKRGQSRKDRLKDPSLYDLVSGAVRQPSRLYSRTGALLTKPFSPAEWYFERKRVKTGDDVEDSRLYWRPEVDEHELPESELLWAIYHHASHFYAKKTKESGEKDENKYVKFMDESALLALGILLEETMKESIGETGHLALLEPTEGTADDQTSDEEESSEDEATRVEEKISKKDFASQKGRQLITQSFRASDKFDKDDFLSDDEDG